jgi:Protein of unknown function (DUF2946)
MDFWLNALAPILAYAHAHVGAHSEIIEYCVADEPGDADTAAQDEHSHHSPPGKGTVPHCPCCAGFAAGLSLAYGGWVPTLHDAVSAAM